MFIDEAIIYVKSGNGGNGVVHFRREKYIRVADRMGVMEGMVEISA